MTNKFENLLNKAENWFGDVYCDFAVGKRAEELELGCNLFAACCASVTRKALNNIVPDVEEKTVFNVPERVIRTLGIAGLGSMVQVAAYKYCKEQNLEMAKNVYNARYGCRPDEDENDLMLFDDDED